MQIKSVNISNVLSFPHQKTILDENKINFDLNKKSGLNILIWPNWSGKSNFLNIIAQLIKYWLVKDFVYQENPENPQNSITENIWPLQNLGPHFSYTDKKSIVDIEFAMSANDKNNMIFIQKNKKTLENIINQYSSLKFKIKNCKPRDIINTNYINIRFKIDNKNKRTSIQNKNKSDLNNFIVDYLIYQELFQIAIIIYNEKIRKKWENNRYPLKNTFAYLHNNRNFHNLQKWDNKHKLWNDFISQKNYKENDPLLWYALCMKKIYSILKYRSKDHRKIKLTKKYIDETLSKSIFFNSLKKSIQKYLNLSIEVVYKNKTIELIFINSLGQKQTIYSISHWEQSLLIILLTIYWFDLKNWLLIIDSPELHFHPQMQKRLAKMLEKLNHNIWTQCIISTYSPIFINEKNISNVYRFSKKHGETSVKVPDRGIWHDESSLIQILKFENAAKIFFVDKIIMVEWEIDAYFFEYYLQYLYKLPQRKNKIINYEIININWKWSYKKRSSFLRKFWIESYFIGDWDNIVDYGYMTQKDLNYYYRQSKIYYHTHKKDNELFNRHYWKLVNSIKNLYPSKYSYIIKKIEDLYKKNIFILKRWDIETYLWMKSKWLEEVIKFCHNSFKSRLSNKKFNEHRKELNDFIATIFKK